LVQREKGVSLNHRGRLDIMANILNMANNGAKKTQLMYKCNLSFKQLELYVNLLVTKKLLTKHIHNGTRDIILYETTTKGHSFLQVYRTLNALLSA
jgi:predicted transcriptional regulator